ncbi:MAG: hypothetical protein HYU41_06205 [Candidatus Rokubacteria bacterium]|nr:hypothetical protein [Candidatus Rokubacteria bacterium]
MGAGVVITQGRTIVQLAAVPSHRARILALFQLGFVGGGPVGALAMGYVARLTGVDTATVYPAVAMLGVLVFLFARSALWRQEATEESAATSRGGVG